MHGVIPFLMPKQFLIIANKFPFYIHSSSAVFPSSLGSLNHTKPDCFQNFKLSVMKFI